MWVVVRAAWAAADKNHFPVVDSQLSDRPEHSNILPQSLLMGEKQFLDYLHCHIRKLSLRAPLGLLCSMVRNRSVE